MKRIRPLFVVLVTFAMTAYRAQAQAPAMDLASFGAPASTFLADNPLIERLMRDGTFQRKLTATAANGSAAAIVFSSNGQHTAIPSKLASAYPAAQRAQVEQLFNALLDAYPKVEDTYKIPHNDLAGAIAVFLIGSYQTASGVVVDDPTVQAVITQVRNALATNPVIAKASNIEKQEMYEELVDLGMFLLTVQQYLKNAPNAQVADNLKRAGTDYIRTFTGSAPELVSMNSAGLSFQKKPASVPPLGSSSPALSAAARVIDSIETVGFDTKASFGIGGSMTFGPKPVVLFRSGDALSNMEGLKFEGGLEAHRAAHPDQWIKWRRVGNTIEISSPQGWRKLPFPKTMDRLPRGFTLAGTYRNISGSGNAGMGGTSSISAWSDYTFDAAGNFTTGGGLHGNDRLERAGTITTTVASGLSPTQRGRYAIDGYTLTLIYADGKTERRMIVTEPADPSVIWLDGNGYTRQ